MTADADLLQSTTRACRQAERWLDEGRTVRIGASVQHVVDLASRFPRIPQESFKLFWPPSVEDPQKLPDHSVIRCAICGYTASVPRVASDLGDRLMALTGHPCAEAP